MDEEEQLKEYDDCLDAVGEPERAGKRVEPSTSNSWSYRDRVEGHRYRQKERPDQAEEREDKDNLAFHGIPILVKVIEELTSQGP